MSIMHGENAYVVTPCSVFFIVVFYDCYKHSLVCKRATRVKILRVIEVKVTGVLRYVNLCEYFGMTNGSLISVDIKSMHVKMVKVIGIICLEKAGERSVREQLKHECWRWVQRDCKENSGRVSRSLSPVLFYIRLLTSLTTQFRFTELVNILHVCYVGMFCQSLARSAIRRSVVDSIVFPPAVITMSARITYFCQRQPRTKPAWSRWQ